MLRHPTSKGSWNVSAHSLHGVIPPKKLEFLLGVVLCLLTHSSSEFNLEALSKKELIAVDILLEAVDYVGVGMVSD